MTDFVADEKTPCPIELYLHSASGDGQGDEYYNDVSFGLPNPVVAPDGYSLYLSLHSFTIVHTFMCVNAYNDTIFIGAEARAVPRGNHSVRTLVAALSVALQTAGVAASYDPISLKVTLSSDAVFTASGPLLETLGIPQNATGRSLSSTHTCDLSGTNSIFVLTDKTGGCVDTRSADGSAAVIARMGVDVQPGGVLNYVDGSQGRVGVEIQDGVLSRLRVTLQDEHRRPLQASIHWDATMQVVFIRSSRRAMVVERPDALRFEPIV